MNKNDTGPDRSDFQDRLRKAKELEARQRAGPMRSELSGMTGFGAAMRIGAELVAGLLVGVGIGYVLDHWFGTAPWMLIVFFFLGSGAGIWNVYKAASGFDATPDSEERQSGDTNKPDPPTGQ